MKKYKCTLWDGTEYIIEANSYSHAIKICDQSFHCDYTLELLTENERTASLEL